MPYCRSNLFPAFSSCAFNEQAARRSEIKSKYPFFMKHGFGYHNTCKTENPPKVTVPSCFYFPCMQVKSISRFRTHDDGALPMVSMRRLKTTNYFFRTESSVKTNPPIKSIPEEIITKISKKPLYPVLGVMTRVSCSLNFAVSKLLSRYVPVLEI